MSTAKPLRPGPLAMAACAAAILALGACGHSDKANETASADNVEMPAEETMSGLAGSAMPQADASAAATDQPDGAPDGADASASAADSASQAVSGPAPGAMSAPPTPAITPAPATATPAKPAKM